eukprot:s3836_g2.t1
MSCFGLSQGTVSAVSDHGPTEIREALRAGAGVSCGIAGRFEEVPDILEDPQVLACFLDLGSGGEVIRTGWEAALPEMSAFDAKATVRRGEKSFEDKILKTWPTCCARALQPCWCRVPGDDWMVRQRRCYTSNSRLQASEPLAQVSGNCPKCGAKLLADSQFCRRCGHRLMKAQAVEMSSAGQEGLQYLCSKYSSLITRLREEVLARQQAEAEARLLESRLREEAEAWQQEKGGMIRELQQLREEIAGLQSQLLAKRLQKADSNAGRDAPAADSADSTWKQYQVQAQQHHQMMSLLAEHSQLQAEQQDTQAELTACQEHLTRWRRKASELESQAALAESGRDEAERRALRSAASAKGRQKEAERVARQDELQMRDLDERLKALRHDSRVNARRAGSAERRLASAEAAEVAAGHLESEVADLRRRLRCAEEQANDLRASNLSLGCLASARILRVEQAEARSAQRAGEVKGELRAAEALNQTNSVHLKDLEVQLMTTREALAEAEADRATKSSWSKRLGHELTDARAKQQEAWQVQEQQAHELREARRRLDQLVGGGTSMPGGQLAQCKRRLLDLEQACSRKEAEVAEERQTGCSAIERRARERCHTEAVRASEKLRAARAQGAQLKERLRTLEEAELRYPSRFPPQRAKPQTSSRRPSRSFSVPAPEGRLRDGRPGRPDSRASHVAHAWMQGTLQTPEPLEPSQSSSTNDDVQVMKDFVKSEEARLRALSAHRERPLDSDPIGPGSYRLSWEEQPRAALPLKASEPPFLRYSQDLSLATLLAMQPQPDKSDQAAAAYRELPAEVAPVLRPQADASFVAF